MNARLMKSAKFKNLVLSHVSSHFRATPAFVRIIPTDRCNYDCAYCWQHDNSSRDMTPEEFRHYLEKAVSLRVGLITFLGGEPLLWGPIYDAVYQCSKRHILSDLTTNGSLLDGAAINKLGEAGLDYLNISVDGLRRTAVTPKDSVVRNDLIGELAEAKRRYHMHYRLNAVMHRQNTGDIKELIEFARQHDVQLSLGYVVPPIDAARAGDRDIYFRKEDGMQLRALIEHIVAKKRAGYPIIDPEAYFTNIFKFLNRESFWECNYPTRYGWINVTPGGKIRSCTKKMDELDLSFLDLNLDNLRDLRALLRGKVDECNIDCYSNCAYDSYYYTHHKLQMLTKIMTRLKPAAPR